MKRAIILTVGTGRGVEHGIATSIKQNNCDHVVFLATEESMKTVQKVKDILKDSPSMQNCSIKIIDNANDPMKCYERSRNVITEVKKDYDEFVADFTSGTKAMTGGLILAAILEEGLALCYVEGERDENGRVVRGTEQLRTIPSPINVIADITKRFVKKMFNVYSFEEAIRLIETIKSKTDDKKICQEYSHLERLVRGYSFWEKFNHEKAWEDFLKTTDNSLINIEKNKQFLSKIRKKDENIYSLMIADLINNAHRRIEEGKYDDAVARLYRIIELIAQYSLKKLNIDTSDVNISYLESIGLTNNVINKYKNNEIRSQGQEKIRLPLTKAFELLADIYRSNIYLDKNKYKFLELGEKYEKDNKLKELLSRRNFSILAHGLEPVCENVARELYDIVKGYAKEVVSDLDELMEMAKFPKFDEFS